ncbi:RNA-binding protein, putative [Hondaea fermentalgiana]|uniref:RNA-binding protein, putative n=1 Tax=Hondaea fermentalgiana TaxID=2315210 RepID=A0A2R5GED2_9STRA|nr:RNA-binding protein, putative [Hondaea fermentalgiana]|eukprot:GBG29307.1 RNA-binding protein, putative [Hondaea fermentalgiana]
MASTSAANEGHASLPQLTRFMYADGGPEPKGPALVPELRRLLELGKISATTLVWTESMEGWQPLQDVALLRALLDEQSNDQAETTKPSAEPSNTEEAASSSAESSTLETAFAPPGDSATDGPASKKKRAKRKRPITAVYVSNVPLDASAQELADHFAKCGLLQTDPLSREPCVKIYTDANGKPKGDAIVVYKLAPSVDNAITILDDSELRLGNPETKMHVERATKQPAWAMDQPAQNSGGMDGHETSDTMERALKLRRMEQEQALSWNEEGVEDRRGLRIVVLKNLFDPADKEVRDDPNFKRELEEDLLDECAKLGDVKKVTVFERHPEGVAIVRFLSARAAELCIERMHGRWFAQRKLVCEFWDGFTDFRKATAGEEEDRRLDALAAKFEAGAP